MPLNIRNSFFAVWGIVLAVVLAFILALIPAITAWDFGGVLPWTVHIIAIALIVTFAISIPLLVANGKRIRLTQLGLPLLGILMALAGWLQTIPLSSAVSSMMSSGVHQTYVDYIPNALRDEYEAAKHQVAQPQLATRGVVDRVSDGSIHSDQLGYSDMHPSSVDAFSTRNAIVAPILAALVCGIAAVSLRDARAVLAALIVTAIAGGAISVGGLLELVRYVAPEDAQNKSVIELAGGAPFGPFINRNNAGGYLNLTLAATAGLLVWALRKSSKGTSVDPQYDLPADTWWERMLDAASRFTRQLDGYCISLILLGALQIAAIAASQSRGALVACALACLVGIVKASGRSRSLHASFILVGIVLVVAARWTLIYLDLQGDVDARVQSIFSVTEGSQVGRAKHIVDAWHASMHYFPGGSGLGTYAYAILPFQQQTAGRVMFLNADCMPMEWLVEGGVWMTAIVVAGIVLTLRTLKAVGNRSRSRFAACHTMGWYLLVSQVVACCFDFGILLPANYLTAALLLGILYGALPMQDEVAPEKQPRGAKPTFSKTTPSVVSKQSSWRDRIGVVAGVSTASLLVAGAFYTYSQTKRAAQTSHDSYRIQQWSELADGTAEEANSLVRYLAKLPSANESGDQVQPTSASFDPERDYQVARWLLLEQQLISDVETVDSRKLARAGVEQLDKETLVRLRSDARIPVRRMETYATRRSNTPNDARLSKGNAVVLLPSQDQQKLAQARQLAVETLLRCPLHPFARLLLIKTDFLITNADDPGNRLDASEQDSDLTMQLADDQIRLRQASPSIVEDVARLIYVHPGPSRARDLIRQALKLQPSLFDSLWPLLRAEQDTDTIARAIPNDIDVMLRVAENTSVPEELRSTMLDRSAKLIAQLIAGIDGSTSTNNRLGNDYASDELYVMQSRIALATEQLPQAIESLTKAVQINPTDLQHRRRLIQVLERDGQLTEAIKQLRRLAIQQPNSKNIEQQIKRLTEQASRR